MFPKACNTAGLSQFRLDAPSFTLKCSLNVGRSAFLSRFYLSALVFQSHFTDLYVSMRHDGLAACNFPSEANGGVQPVALADERPQSLWDLKPVGEPGSSSAVPSNPNSREGRLRVRSPLRQGWDRRYRCSKDRLDVHVLPVGEYFFVATTMSARTG